MTVENANKIRALFRDIKYEQAPHGTLYYTTADNGEVKYALVMSNQTFCDSEDPDRYLPSIPVGAIQITVTAHDDAENAPQTYHIDLDRPKHQIAFLADALGMTKEEIGQAFLEWHTHLHDKGIIATEPFYTNTLNDNGVLTESYMDRAGYTVTGDGLIIEGLALDYLFIDKILEQQQNYDLDIEYENYLSTMLREGTEESGLIDADITVVSPPSRYILPSDSRRTVMWDRPPTRQNIMLIEVDSLDDINVGQVYQGEDGHIEHPGALSLTEWREAIIAVKEQNQSDLPWEVPAQRFNAIIEALRIRGHDPSAEAIEPIPVPRRHSQDDLYRIEVLPIGLEEFHKAAETAQLKINSDDIMQHYALPKIDPWNIPMPDISETIKAGNIPTVMRHSVEPISTIKEEIEKQSAAGKRIRPADLVTLTTERELFHEAIAQLVTTTQASSEEELKQFSQAIMDNINLSEVKTQLTKGNEQEAKDIIRHTVQEALAEVMEEYNLAPLTMHSNEDRQLFCLMGSPASGKGHTGMPYITDKLGSERDICVINPDLWKNCLVGNTGELGHDKRFWGTLLHDESRLIENKVIDYVNELAANGAAPDIVLDRSLIRPAMLDTLRENFAGDKVDIVFTYAPVEETVVRSAERGIATGRFLPTSILLDITSETVENLQLFMDDPSIDIVLLNSRSTAADASNIIAAKTEDGLTIYDPAAFADFTKFDAINKRYAGEGDWFISHDGVEVTPEEIQHPSYREQSDNIAAACMGRFIDAAPCEVTILGSSHAISASAADNHHNVPPGLKEIAQAEHKGATLH